MVDSLKIVMAARTFQAWLMLNGAEIDHPEPGLFGYEPKNIFRSADGSQKGFQ